MWVCSVVLNHEMDSVAVSAVGNTKVEACAFINTDPIADYFFDQFPQSVIDEFTDRIAKARREGDLEDLMQIGKKLGTNPQIFFNKLGA